MAERNSNRGRWMALTAAFLGWMFDGFEMGLFPLVANPALKDLLHTQNDALVGKWLGVIMAGFLVGAATGGGLFGWLGDRIGRVRAMALSILTYAIFSGLCGFAHKAELLLVLRFVASLGMGGEWSLGVSLVMEIWPAESRGWLAGLIGAAANVGFALVAVMGMAISGLLATLQDALLAIQVPQSQVEMLVSNGGWRILMLSSAFPAILTFLIQILVPESEKWLEEHGKGSTSHWATVDLVGVLIGALGPLGMIYLWASDTPLGLTDSNVILGVRVTGSVLGLAIAIFGYTYPVSRYLQRVGKSETILGAGGRPVRQLMMLGAVLSGVALLGTWGSMQWAPTWADTLPKAGSLTNPRAYTQITMAVGAIIATFIAALSGQRFGRRLTYVVLCLLSLTTVLIFFQTNQVYGPMLLVWAFIAGGITAAFYGWLPLYLPELFPTRVRATGQGFAFNFGRILAAVGALQAGNLMKHYNNYPLVCSIMSCIYLVGVVVIWFVPETKNEELPV